MKNNIEKTHQPSRRKLLLGGLSASTLLLTGCPVLFVGGVVVTGLAAIDRRSAGAQVDDKTLPIKVKQEILKVVGDDAHIVVNCYNRQVLITGEVASAQDKSKAEAAAKQIRDVGNIVNALAIGPSTSFSTRSGDTYITTRVKTALTDVDGLSTTNIKVITERAVVYLMGIVTAKEADIAAKTTAIVAGVRQVVRVFEVLSEEEIKKIDVQYGQGPTAPTGGEN